MTFTPDDIYDEVEKAERLLPHVMAYFHHLTEADIPLSFNAACATVSWMAFAMGMPEADLDLLLLGIKERYRSFSHHNPFEKYYDN